MTANESTALTTILLVAGVGSIPILFASILFSRRGGISTSGETQIYRCHPFVFWLSVGSTGLVTALFVAAVVLLPRHDPITVGIFGGAAVGVFVLGWLSSRKLQTAYIRLRGDSIEFKYGRGVKTLRFENIWSVHVRMGYILVLTAPRKVALLIPPIFRNSRQLLYHLRADVRSR
jgi:hypothetical protein